MKYSHIIYDFANRLPRFGSMLFLLSFVVVGVVFFISYKRSSDRTATTVFGTNKRIYGMVFGIIFATISGLISIGLIPNMLGEYFDAKEVYDKKLYKTIEGLVQNYHPMPYGGHDTERFSVQGVEFDFSDFDESDYGYNNSASHGGAIRAGLKVRIRYYDNGQRNVILKLETE